MGIAPSAAAELGAGGGTLATMGKQPRRGTRDAWLSLLPALSLPRYESSELLSSRLSPCSQRLGEQEGTALCQGCGAG